MPFFVVVVVVVVVATAAAEIFVIVCFYNTPPATSLSWTKRKIDGNLPHNKKKRRKFETDLPS